MTRHDTIAIVGLGYVGLPLAVEFERKYPTIAYDVVRDRIEHYRRGEDPRRETASAAFREPHNIEFTSDPKHLAQADVVIVAVPTPVDGAHQPDFAPLLSASETVGRNLKKGAIVVYESTVYPGATEEICVPALERASGCRWKRDFFVGYSPEWINPGDRELTLTRIVKVVSGDTAATAQRVAQLYASIIPAGVHCTSSIRVAEAAKVIENTQRDLNIALMNELAILFNKLEYRYQGGTAGCAHQMELPPFSPRPRRRSLHWRGPLLSDAQGDHGGISPGSDTSRPSINDGMAKFIVEQIVKQRIRRGQAVLGARVAVSGVTFEEDCRDTRNSKVFDVITE